MILPILTIAPSAKRGRGVFATEDIAKGTVIEISPVIVLTAKERKIVEQTKLFNYLFEWGPNKKMACVALGYLSVYNHDYSSNCEYDMDFTDRTIKITTIKPVKKGDELFINYNADPDSKTRVWFDKQK